MIIFSCSLFVTAGLAVCDSVTVYSYLPSWLKAGNVILSLFVFVPVSSTVNEILGIVGFSESLTSPSPVTCVAVKLNVSAFPTSVL